MSYITTSQHRAPPNRVAPSIPSAASPARATNHTPAPPPNCRARQPNGRARQPNCRARRRAALAPVSPGRGCGG
eukprot:1267756-Prymnesium_polylepis.1